jgi:GDP-L-fucose synthase
MTKVLVTGSKGLLGSAIVARSAHFGQHDFIFHTRESCDLTSSESTRKYISRIRPDVVIHTAALVGGINANANAPLQFYLTNTTIDLNVLKACIDTNVPELIGFLSSCIFPDRVSYPITYGSLHTGIPHTSNFGYAHAKRGLDVLVSASRKQLDVNYKLFIPTNLFGENDNFDLDNSHVIPGLIHKFFNAKKTATSPKVWGSGSPLREFVYARDAADVILNSIGEEFIEPVFLNNGGKESSIKEVAEIIAREFGIEEQLIFDISKPDGQLRKPTKNADWVEKILGPQPSTDLPVALQATINWFKVNYPNVRKGCVEL